MSTLVVYTSKTGSTQKYAQAIAARLNGTALPAASASAEVLAKADTVVYGGWIFASKISGLAKIRPLVKGRLIVFAVGATPPASIDLATLRAGNALDNMPLFYFEGGFHFEKLGFFAKFMLKTVSKMAAKQEPKNDQGLKMSDLIGADFNHSDMAAIEPLIAAAQA